MVHRGVHELEVSARNVGEGVLYRWSLIKQGMAPEEIDVMADAEVRRVMAAEVNRPENRGYADNGIAAFRENAQANAAQIVEMERNYFTERANRQALEARLNASTPLDDDAGEAPDPG